MNLILLEAGEVSNDRVRLRGRRLDHVRNVHRATAGTALRVGIIGGRIGTGIVETIDDEGLDMSIHLEIDPPAPLPLRLILALPRPKVLNRTIAAAVSMGIRDIDLINAWRVEKAYWSSPKLLEDNLRMQSILGLEQSGDTMLPTIHLHKLFARFVRDELPKTIDGRLALLADPGGKSECPRGVVKPTLLAIGPEGGFIERELETFRDVGFEHVSLGRRILRVETALPYLVGRLFD